MSACGAGEAYTSVVSRAFRCASWGTWSAMNEQPTQPYRGQSPTPGSPPFRGQRVAGPGELLLLHPEPEARSLPLLG
jgi:hypothetical protein